jgi:hypothetical protein
MIVSALFSRAELLAVPIDDVWRTLAAFGDISVWAPNVSHSRLIGDAALGDGATRRVQVGNAALIETVTRWEPPHRLAYRIEGLPAWLGRVTNEWRLSAYEDHTRVTIVTTVEPPRGLLALPIQQFAGRRLAAVSDQLLKGINIHHSNAGVKS